MTITDAVHNEEVECVLGAHGLDLSEESAKGDPAARVEAVERCVPCGWRCWQFDNIMVEEPYEEIAELRDEGLIGISGTETLEGVSMTKFGVVSLNVPS